MQYREKICIFKPHACYVHTYKKNERTTHLDSLILYIHEYSLILPSSLILYRGGGYAPHVPISTYYRGKFTICQVFFYFFF